MPLRFFQCVRHDRYLRSALAALAGAGAKISAVIRLMHAELAKMRHGNGRISLLLESWSAELFRLRVWFA
jgi:hypothetical protein